MKPKKPSNQLLKRLTIYLSYLKTLPESLVHISATSIAKALDLGDGQVRKDLARVSNGGQRRVGHVRSRLIQDIESFLEFSVVTNAVILYSEDVGSVPPERSDFEQYGLNIRSGFCLRGSQSGESGLLPASGLEAFCREENIRIGILAVAAEDAQQACDKLVACGIRAIWNFTPARIRTPAGVAVHNENLAHSATALRIQLESRNGTNNG